MHNEKAYFVLKSSYNSIRHISEKIFSNSLPCAIKAQIPPFYTPLWYFVLYALSIPLWATTDSPFYSFDWWKISVLIVSVYPNVRYRFYVTETATPWTTLSICRHSPPTKVCLSAHLWFAYIEEYRC